MVRCVDRGAHTGHTPHRHRQTDACERTWAHLEGDELVVGDVHHGDEEEGGVALVHHLIWFDPEEVLMTIGLVGLPVDRIVFVCCGCKQAKCSCPTYRPAHTHPSIPPRHETPATHHQQSKPSHPAPNHAPSCPATRGSCTSWAGAQARAS